MVHGLPSIEQPKGLCGGCSIRKKTRISLSSHIPTTKTPLEFVFSYVCGPMDDLSLRGNQYFDSFVDDFTWRLWVYLIK